jgi:hypothetical protein
MPIRWKIPRPQFSLLTLILFVVFAGGCMGLWFKGKPWGCDVILQGHTDDTLLLVGKMILPWR